MTDDSNDGTDAASERDDSPVIVREELTAIDTDERSVGGVLLAAGTGSRFGAENKLLAELDDEPVVRRAAETLTGAGLDPVVVLGHESEAVRSALADLPVSFALNEDYAEGQSTSLRRGVETARERGWDGVVFALGDMPAISPESIELLRRAYANGWGRIVAAACEAKRGNPVLFDATYFDALTEVTGDTGGRDVLMDNEVVLVETGDPGVLNDIDRQPDLDDLR